MSPVGSGTLCGSMKGSYMYSLVNKTCAVLGPSRGSSTLDYICVRPGFPRL